MSISNPGMRRYQIQLPRTFNDGQPVPAELIAQILREIEDQFGAVSARIDPIQGWWRHEGKTYADESILVYVDVPDTPRSYQFFLDLKEKAKIRFQQIDIWLTSFPIDVL